MRIPLHINSDPVYKTKRARDKLAKKRARDLFDLHSTMRTLNPGGFPEPPTSPKNPATHREGPMTRLEQLARAAGYQ